MFGEMLTLRNVTKRFDGFAAVDRLSFEVHAGEVFGLLGPNGAGKTTTIRAIMDIFAADEGEISVLGQPPGEARARVGYLPEERGLYRDLKVIDVLVYLAELKGTPRGEGHERATHWLEQVDLTDWATRKVKDLSRGMQQKVQFVASLVHDPDLLILDEPFQGLDPINVDLLQELIRKLQQNGKTVVLSAHQMNLVEEMCDRIVLIHKGKGVLYGSLDDIKGRYAPNTVRVRTQPDVDLNILPGVKQVDRYDGTFAILRLEEDRSPQELLRTLVERQIAVQSFEIETAPLEEIFIAVVKEQGHA